MNRTGWNFSVWVVASLILAGAGAACGTIETLTKSKIDDEDSKESGFNENGEAARCKSVPDGYGYACTLRTTPFTEACLNSGFQIKSCEDRTLLCAEKVTIPPPKSDSTPRQGTNKECQYHGKTYSAGQEFPSADGCNSCTCERETGIASCTEISCPNIQPFDGIISNARVDALTDELVATLEYQSCGKVPFILEIDSENCGKASPWQCSAFIFETTETRTACTLQIQHEVRFSLAALKKRPAALNVRGAHGSCVRILVGVDAGAVPDLCQ